MTATKVAQDRRQTLRRSWRRTNPVFTLPAWAMMALVSLSMLAPAVFLLFTSLRTYGDYSRNPLSIPREWTLENFSVALSAARLDEYAFNTVVVVVTATIAVVVVSALAAYPLVFMQLRGKALIMTSIIALMILPASILDLQSTYLGLILVYVGLTLPFGIFLLSNTYRSIPTELLGAAAIDGASSFQALRYVVLPMSAPALRTLTVLAALGYWNELLFSLVIMQDPSKRTLTSALALINTNPIAGGASNFTIQAAALSMTAAVPFILYLAFHRNLSQGMTAGALR
jgi:raffinose/stachyose/melibiose transport system permease protein